MSEQTTSKEKVSDDRLRNTRAWAAARLGQLSGAEVIVAACDEALAARAAQVTSKEKVLNDLRRVHAHGGLGYQAHDAIEAAITLLECSSGEPRAPLSDAVAAAYQPDQEWMNSALGAPASGPCECRNPVRGTCNSANCRFVAEAHAALRAAPPPGLELPILRNCLGNLYAAVKRLPPSSSPLTQIDKDINFAMSEAARALGSPYSTATKETSLRDIDEDRPARR